jgi:dipicolinate synthase subunit A
VHVAARNPVQRAAAYAAGAEPHELGDLHKVFPGTDIVIASVPARIIGADLLELLPKHALLVDLAAPPGSIDREAAQALGLKFIWARGMGARAPITVGRSQWSGVFRRIEGILKERV